MAKSFTINTPKYQTAQKEFYAYNVANNESVLNTSNVKSATFSFHLTDKNMIFVKGGSDTRVSIVYRLNDENTATLISLQDFYTSNYDKIIDMSAKGNYVINDNGADGVDSISANSIFSKDINAYIFNMTEEGTIINAFILAIGAAAKAILTFLVGGKDDGVAALLDSFTFGVLPAHMVDSSEEDESKLAGIFMLYGFPYFGDAEGSTDEGGAESDISVTIYYKGDDE